VKSLIESLLRRLRRDAEWNEELKTHVAMRAEWYQEQGLTSEEAQAAARREFGSELRALEGLRAVYVRPWLEGLWQDARHALRGFRRSAGFTAVAIATLSVGIGASTGVFSIVDPLLFRSLPYYRGDRLVSLGFKGPIDVNEFQLGNFHLDWQRKQTVFDSLTSMRPAYQCDLGSQTPQRIACIAVEANFLRTLGISPAIGREFTKDDDRPHAPLVALVSYGLWKREFGGSQDALGKGIEIDGEPVRVIGVLPSSFEMPQLVDADILLPEQLDEAVARAPGATVFLRSFARLHDGISIDQAREQLRPLFEESLQQVPASLRYEVQLVVRSVRDRQIQDVKLASWMLFGSVLGLLLLACANVANLLLARSAARRRELALRAAIGAGRGRLIRQLLTENLMLGLLGGVFGCVIAWSSLRLFVAISPAGIVRLAQAKIDLRILAFALAMSLLSTLVFGLAPALERPNAENLTGWRDTGSFRTLFRQLLVATQVAISLVLLTGASLLFKSWRNLEAEPLGFEREHVVAASVILRNQAPSIQAVFLREMEARLKEIPGGGVVAFSDSIPPSGGMHGRPYSNMRIAGGPELSKNGGMVGFRWVTPDYFQAMGIRILAGRTFQESERASGPSPLILSQSLARKMFGNENPVGQQIDLNVDGQWSKVVGVVADVKNAGLAEAGDPEYYRLRMNDSFRDQTNVAIFRTSLDPATLTRWIRQQIAALDPTLPVTIQTMDAHVEHLMERPRFISVLVGLFALMGLLLAAIGIYGVISFLVAQRTREIGVRMAVGATPMDIALLIQKHASLWTAAGAITGVAGSMALTRLVRGLLFGVSPNDPWSLVAGVAAIAVAAALAAWVPSRRAARVDPVIALRCE
jgi:putative ABC transport system permease protein